MHDYRNRFVTPEAAAQAVRSGDWVDYGFGAGFPELMDRALPELYRSYIQVDVAFVPVSRPDGEGYCGLGISNYAWRTIFENARTVIFEINERLPRLQGVNGSHRVHLSEADYIVEGAPAHL